MIVCLPERSVFLSFLPQEADVLPGRTAVEEEEYVPRERNEIAAFLLCRIRRTSMA